MSVRRVIPAIRINCEISGSDLPEIIHAIKLSNKVMPICMKYLSGSLFNTHGSSPNHHTAFGEKTFQP